MKEKTAKNTVQLCFIVQFMVLLNDSLEFLKEFNKPVDYLYLDSYDYSKKDKGIQIRSQEHHLKEFQTIENQLHDNSVVLIDDCRLPGGGKGKKVVEYMIKRDWVILLDKYQILLVKKNSLSTRTSNFNQER